MSLANYLTRLTNYGFQHALELPDAGTPETDAIGSMDATLSGTVSSGSALGQAAGCLTTGADGSVGWLNNAAPPADIQTMGATGGAWCVCGLLRTATAGTVPSNATFALRPTDHVIFALLSEDTGARVAFALTDAGKIAYSHASNTNSAIAYTPSVAGTINDGAAHFVAVRRSGATLTVQIDDARADIAVTDGDHQLGSGPATIRVGSSISPQYAGADHCPGDYAGWAIKNGAVSDAELDALYIDALIGINYGIQSGANRLTVGGSPVAVPVRVYDPVTGELVAQITSGTDGHYQIGGLIQGRYYEIRAGADDWDADGDGIQEGVMVGYFTPAELP